MSLWRPAAFTLDVACDRPELQERLHYLFAAWTDPQERIMIHGEIGGDGAVTFSASPTGGIPTRFGTAVTGSGRVEPRSGGARVKLDAGRLPVAELLKLAPVGAVVYVLASGLVSGTPEVRTVSGIAVASGVVLTVGAIMLQLHSRLWGQVRLCLAAELPRPLTRAEREELAEIVREDAEFEAELAREEAGGAETPADGFQASRIDNRPIE